MPRLTVRRAVDDGREVPVVPLEPASATARVEVAQPRAHAVVAGAGRRLERRRGAPCAPSRGSRAACARRSPPRRTPRRAARVTVRAGSGSSHPPYTRPSAIERASPSSARAPVGERASPELASNSQRRTTTPSDAVARAARALGDHAKPAHLRVRDVERHADRLQRVEAPRADRAGARLLARVPRLLEERDARGRDASAPHEVQRGGRARPGPPPTMATSASNASRPEPQTRAPSSSRRARRTDSSTSASSSPRGRAARRARARRRARRRPARAPRSPRRSP